MCCCLRTWTIYLCRYKDVKGKTTSHSRVLDNAPGHLHHARNMYLDWCKSFVFATENNCTHSTNGVKYPWSKVSRWSKRILKILWKFGKGVVVLKANYNIATTCSHVSVWMAFGRELWRHINTSEDFNQMGHTVKTWFLATDCHSYQQAICIDALR